MKICGLTERTLTDYPGHTACTIFTGGCNFRCPYCNQRKLWDYSAEPVISEDEFFSFLDRAAADKSLDSVVISGGEPTLQAELPDFIRHIKGYYGFKVKLCTNASNITMIDEFLCEGMIDYIAMDIKAGHEGFKKIAGVEPQENIAASVHGCLDLFEGKFEGLPLFPYEFRTTVVGGLYTEDDFQEIGELLHGIRRYVLQYYKPCTLGQHMPSEQCVSDSEQNNFRTPTRAEMLRVKEIIAPHVGEVVIRHLDMS